MRSIQKIFFILLLCSGCDLSAQEVFTFQKASAKGLHYQQLDSIYGHAAGLDTAALRRHVEENENHHALTLKKLGHFLKKQNYQCEPPLRLYTKIYWNEGGKLVYFLYHFLTAQGTLKRNFDQRHQRQFEDLVRIFSAGYDADGGFNRKIASAMTAVYDE
ncbi:hypothetical protein [Pedobacter sp. GR22-6]|uniref:hypothetical protein n=1 Tax=Pedobacter sp. GR22-6 TaxID=3127957 RepID=UPI00307CD47A